MKFSEIGPLVHGVTKQDPASRPEARFDYIDLSSINRFSKAIAGPTNLPTVEAPSRARQLVQTGDVLVSTVRPNLNAVAKVPLELDGATASTGFTVLRAKADQLDPAYLLHWVRSDRFVKEMVGLATGASYPAVTDKIVKKSLIPLVPLEEQRRIASILDAADELRTKRQQAIDQLDTLTQTIFHDMFSIVSRRGKVVSANTPMGVLGDLAELRSGYGFPVKHQGRQFGDFPFAKVGDISTAARAGSRYLTAASNYVNESDLSTLKAEPFQRGTVAFAKIGEAIRQNFRVIADVDLLLDNNVMGLVPRAGIEPSYLFALMRVVDLYPMAQSTTVPSIRKSELARMPVPVPSSSLQRRFVELDAAIIQRQSLLAESCIKADALCASLQQRAFRGDL